jgi:hypothetical protein
MQNDFGLGHLVEGWDIFKNFQGNQSKKISVAKTVIIKLCFTILMHYCSLIIIIIFSLVVFCLGLLLNVFNA